MPPPTPWRGGTGLLRRVSPAGRGHLLQAAPRSPEGLCHMQGQKCPVGRGQGPEHSLCYPGNPTNMDMLYSAIQSCPTLCNTVYYSQAPLSTGFSRQEYWNGLPFPTPGYLPDPRIEPASLTSLLHWQAGSLPLRH